MGAPPPLLWLLLGGLWLQSVCLGSHSMRFFLSGLSGPIPGVPQFFSVVFVDDVEISRYSSGSRLLVPRAPSMEKFNSYVPPDLDWETEKFSAQDPQYQDLETQINKVNEQVSINNVKSVMDRVNQTQGLHVVQWVFGCDLRSDGSLGGFSQDAFDGRDFFGFDMDRLRWTSASEAARVTVDQWNEERGLAQGWRSYLKDTCIEYLRKHLENGEESLRRVRPETMVYRKKTDAGTTLTCYAYSFYPREIEVKWVRNGAEMPWTSKQILPNPDGTYQVKTTVEVYEGDDERNSSCQVDHSSLEEIVTVVYEDTSSPPVNIGPIAGGVVVGGLLLLAAAIGGFLFWKKKHSDSTASESSNRSQPKDEAECKVLLPEPTQGT